jgi:UDPglucose 6-dehydrogenase
MQIGIIGVGVIGGSLRKWFLENTEHELRLYDPQKGFTDSVTSCNVCFICVTCNNDQNGNQDLSQVKAAIKLCDHKSKIFIRSTVLPGTVQALRHEFSMNIFSCPEFLTQRDADSDMYRLPILTSCEDMDYMSHIFPLKAIYTMKHTECEMAKYTHNCFGAMKVGFFNVIYEQCEKLGIDYKEV